jgi:hypothetical protein
MDELAAFHASGSDFLQEHAVAMDHLEVNRASRASAMMTLFYASLNVVIEGWRQENQAPPRLADSRIDALLASDFPRVLADYRNAMLHPNPLLDARFVRVPAEYPGLKKWAFELCDEFLRFFRAWRGFVTFGHGL